MVTTVNEYPIYRANLIQRATNKQEYNDFARTPEERLTAILADARHYAVKHELDFDEVDNKAYHMYLRDLQK